MIDPQTLLTYLRRRLAAYPEDVFVPPPPIASEATPADRVARTVYGAHAMRFLLRSIIAEVEAGELASESLPPPAPDHAYSCGWSDARTACVVALATFGATRRVLERRVPRQPEDSPGASSRDSAAFVGESAQPEAPTPSRPGEDTQSWFRARAQLRAHLGDALGLPPNTPWIVCVDEARRLKGASREAAPSLVPTRPGKWLRYDTDACEDVECTVCRIGGCLMWAWGTYRAFQPLALDFFLERWRGPAPQFEDAPEMDARTALRVLLPYVVAGVFCAEAPLPWEVVRVDDWNGPGTPHAWKLYAGDDYFDNLPAEVDGPAFVRTINAIGQDAREQPAPSAKDAIIALHLFERDKASNRAWAAELARHFGFDLDALAAEARAKKAE